MKKVILGAMMLTFVATSMTSCKKKGCIDADADNYNSEAKKDDGTCTYPTISFTEAGSGLSGDVNGDGGSNSSSYTWNNSGTAADVNMDFTAASGGTYKLELKDASGAVMFSGILNDNSSDDTISALSSSGQSGDWTVTITLTDFSGDGSFSMSPE